MCLCQAIATFASAFSPTSADFTQLSESKDLLRLARTLGRHIAVLEWDPQQAQHGGCGAWDLALFPPGRGGAPWAFCLQRREDVMPELFAALYAPATLRLLWREPGRFAAAQLVQPRDPAGGSSTGKVGGRVDRSCWLGRSGVVQVPVFA